MEIQKRIRGVDHLCGAQGDDDRSVGDHGDETEASIGVTVVGFAQKEVMVRESKQRTKQMQERETSSVEDPWALKPD